MNAPPRHINGLVEVVLFSPIDFRHQPTGKCWHTGVHGKIAGLAICKQAGETGYYLFGCNYDWNPITDTWHESVAEAKAQAEFEYEGVSATWQFVQ